MEPNQEMLSNAFYGSINILLIMTSLVKSKTVFYPELNIISERHAHFRLAFLIDIRFQ